ncbi:MULTISPECIES: 16S rRNA (guanine(527)-N(7))-methyltransferase RsmG [unclassified Microbacterium]|uniref:16S rRNA (guanine(527)-N(7))-methyltransferase RsmG n=1 Tax=unclassified Microbacterium TaxID=2609290 RepID=UPI000CFBB8AD|nr:16S rRNA (guanine(527)-N(7))-methyltransferase RsmG [Microbacterium sp. MYb43]PQZ80736.1 16S rRNA (guanine(527)-N(7))-methyltransferase RsmG [Microbacterium sp. MYb40]PRB20336.1 16S rRNA (guanine(527)-N(7))-methyltransferase RsmG [Microbacterium sp. MYb54]PRB32007.1 16S rRNA (guanine(527)-N(7))-methyltransferase RsmG [Microbacterium sp. MYb50]PRB66403.1 16S rRNA (guanine(527)-N(7))-methyltransferase RsmG [Microbacterium sp. MYb24]PRB77748.1 16S rRNA (guanine(527)-N(7))-methyltransferase Rsm
MSDLELELEPAVAGELFGDRIDIARAFTAALAREGEERGLIGPLELPRLWTRHILNSVIAAPLFYGSVADIGSGAGLPGIVLAISRPDVQWTLVEPMERRVTWLNEQVSALELGNVTVLRARAEDVRSTDGFDVVTARAVSALRTLIPITAPLVRDGGELALLKGMNVANEIEAAQKQIKKFRLTNVRVEVLGERVLPETTRVLRARVR